MVCSSWGRPETLEVPLPGGWSSLPSARSGPRPHLASQAWCVVRACVLSCFSRVRLFVTPWTVAHEAPLSMGFPRQEYWSGLPFPSPGDLPDPGMEPTSPVAPALQANSLPLGPLESSLHRLSHLILIRKEKLLLSLFYRWGN